MQGVPHIDVVTPPPKLWSASTVKTEDHDMSLIRNRRGFLSAMFSALLPFALFDSGEAAAQEAKQIKLTEKHIQGFMAASKDMASLYDGVDPDKPDPKIESRAEAVARRNGFASPAEYNDVAANISMIMSGIDPQTKKFTEPPEQIRKQIARSKPTNPSRRGKRRTTWRTSRRRSRPQGPFSSRKTLRWC